jgi:hypothetical protein
MVSQLALEHSTWASKGRRQGNTGMCFWVLGSAGSTQSRR